MDKTIAEYILYTLNKHCTIDYGDMNEAQVTSMIIDAYNHEQNRLNSERNEIENASPTCPDCNTEHTNEEICPCDIPF